MAIPIIPANWSCKVDPAGKSAITLEWKLLVATNEDDTDPERGEPFRVILDDIRSEAVVLAL